MLKLVFLTIILYIIIQHLMDETDEVKIQSEIKDEKILSEIKDEKKSIQKDQVQNKILENNYYQSNQEMILSTNFDKRVDDVSNRSGTVSTIQVPKIISQGKLVNNLNSKNRESFTDNIQQLQKSEVKEIIFDRPNPWSKIIVDERQEYPYLFYLKVKIPSLNDLENWKVVVPNIEFDPRTGELIIPSKDEPSAIALANLIVINFTGQISLKDILDKNLIGISVTKAKSFEVVQNKLREQIMENLFGKQFNTSQTSFEKDLAKKPETVNNINEQTNNKVDFTSEAFTDTFEHFSENNIEDGIDAWDGNDFSYL